ncbi:MAG TPA: hypothetical protein VGN84_00385 [Solirubrobacterales bacterium]|nr:hypothetical protein [Solirubrobacterales bacterium]
MKKLALVPALLALVVLAAAAGGSSATAATSCPSFRVLHNDRIGSAVFPAGSYAISIASSANLSCAAASKNFTRFLADYDGVLPRPWTVLAEGSGKASFRQAGVVAFSVARSSGGGEGNSSLGVLCKGTFTVNAGSRVGPLFFPKGPYLLYIPPRSGISCNRASVLFTRFLGAGGMLPPPWRTIAQTATFYKPANPQRSAFRVEPLSGAGPR